MRLGLPLWPGLESSRLGSVQDVDEGLRSRETMMPCATMPGAIRELGSKSVWAHWGNMWHLGWSSAVCRLFCCVACCGSGCLGTSLMWLGFPVIVGEATEEFDAIVLNFLGTELGRNTLCLQESNLSGMPGLLCPPARP